MTAAEASTAALFGQTPWLVFVSLCGFGTGFGWLETRPGRFGLHSFYGRSRERQWESPSKVRTAKSVPTFVLGCVTTMAWASTGSEPRSSSGSVHFPGRVDREGRSCITGVP